MASKKLCVCGSVIKDTTRQKAWPCQQGRSQTASCVEPFDRPMKFRFWFFVAALSVLALPTRGTSKSPSAKKAANSSALKESPKESTKPASAAETVIYEQNFETLEAGPVSKEFLPLAGEFTVAVEEGAHCLELPGAPLDTFGALFGPSNGEPGSLQGRFYGTKAGRKYPTFGLSLRGAGGYRLQMSPGKGQLEIYKGDDPLVGVPFTWQSGTWTWLKLVVRKAGESGWVVEGRAWIHGENVPAEPQVRHEIPGDIAAGRAALWGSPYSGTPIRFDDLRWTTP